MSRVICAYDPTLLDFSRQNWKSKRMAIGDGGGMGYEWLNAMLVDPESKRLLGPIHQTLVSKSGPDDAAHFDYCNGAKARAQRKELLFNPANQFVTIASAVDARLPPGLEVIHVADREFDDGLVLRARARSAMSHFVIRGNDSRIVEIAAPTWLPAALHRPASRWQIGPAEPGLVNVHLKDLVRHLPCVHSRTLALDSRGRVCTNPENVARTAHLAVGTVPVRLARRSKRGIRAHIQEEPVWLNLVPPARSSFRVRR